MSANPVTAPPPTEPSLFAAGVCRFCKCTDERACEGGCSWSDPEETICSHCAVSGDIAERIVEIFRRITQTKSLGTVRMEPAAWSEFSHEQQQLLVMTCRASIEAVTESLLEGLQADALTAGVELNVLGQFLYEKCPTDLREDESISANVIRLLEPHVGARIVLP